MGNRKESNVIYLIQGMFFQSGERPTIGHGPEGVAVYMERQNGRFLFSGAIWKDRKGEPIGTMRDAFGISDLAVVEMTDTAISFVKVYRERGDGIEYAFTQRDGISWVGTWEGEEVGNGIARLIVTEVPDEFFLIEPLLAVLAPKADAKDDIPF